MHQIQTFQTFKSSGGSPEGGLGELDSHAPPPFCFQGVAGFPLLDSFSLVRENQMAIRTLSRPILPKDHEGFIQFTSDWVASKISDPALMSLRHRLHLPGKAFHKLGRYKAIEYLFRSLDIMEGQ